ncbi:MAG: pyruvate, phosphate dikinase [Candidatus Binatia bacterium]
MAHTRRAKTTKGKGKSTARAAAQRPAKTQRRGAIKQMVFAFEAGRADGNAGMKALLGGKGANLAEMAALGLPVPPGFTISTNVCTYFDTHQRRYPAGLEAEVQQQLGRIEKNLGRRFGDATNPLLVSVRSGARASMPGMMDTIQNLGLNDQTVQGLIAQSGNPRFAYDCYRRFVQMYGDIVLGLRPEIKYGADPFDVIIERKKHERGVRLDRELGANDLRELVGEFKAAIRERRGVEFPEDPYKQLWGAIGAVFGSWMNERAIAYRKMNNIPESWGTAVNVQAMVFGNRGNDSGTGEACTRDPATGENVLYGDFLMNAQGEDVIAGIRTPMPIADLEREAPTIYRQLAKIRRTLERHYREIIEIEFTIEQGRLYIVQCRMATRAAQANLRLAVDLFKEKLVDRREAVNRVSPKDLERIMTPKLCLEPGTSAIATGVKASPGVASGIAVFDAQRAETLGAMGQKVILIRPTLGGGEEDAGLRASQAFVGSRGGVTSQAAIRCRDMGKPCVNAEIVIDAKRQLFTASGQTVREGDVITVDGSSGEIYWGEVPVVRPRPKDDPYLARYGRLLEAVNSDDCVEEGLGTLWLKRDIVAGSIPLPAVASSPLISGQETGSKIRQRKYVSFVQPSKALIQEILDALHWQRNPDDADTTAVVLGIMRTLERLLQTETGTGHQHLAIRPLTDPERSLVRDKRAAASCMEEQCLQLIGMEFFGINHFLPNYLDLACVQWWGVVQCNRQFASRPWKLDATNPRRESLCHGEEQLVAFLVIRDGDPLGCSEMRQFYNELRKREAGWDWYRANRTTRADVLQTLRSIEARTPVRQSMVRKCGLIGLVDRQGRLTSVGRPLVHEQTAVQRKGILFGERTLRPEPPH